MFKKDEIEFITEGLDGQVLVKGSRKKIKIPVVDIDELGIELPEMEYTTTLRIGKNEMKELISDIKQIGEAVKFKKDRAIVVDSQHEYEIEFESGDGDDEIVVGINYLELAGKLNAFEYELKFGSDTPLFIRAESDDVVGEFLIAPRLEE